MTHPFTTHDIARLRHDERVAMAHAAVHTAEAQETRSARAETGVQRAASLLHWLRRRGSVAPQTPARTGTS